MLWKVFLFCLPLLCFIPLYYDDVYPWYLFCAVCCFLHCVVEIYITYILPKYLIHYICKYSVINCSIFLFVLTTQNTFHINSEDVIFFCPFEGQALQVWWVSNRLFWQNVQLCSNDKCALCRKCIKIVLSAHRCFHPYVYNNLRTHEWFILKILY